MSKDTAGPYCEFVFLIWCAAFPGWCGHHVWALPAATGGNIEIPLGLLGLSHAGLLLVRIFSDRFYSYKCSPGSLSRVFAINLVPLISVMAQGLWPGLPYVLSSQAQPQGTSQTCTALCKKPEAFGKCLSCTVVLSGCRGVRFSVSIPHLGGKRTQVHRDAAASLLWAIKML